MFTCSLSWLWSLICSRNRFGMSPNIMHHTHVIISFWDVDAFGIAIFSSFLDLDMDCIIIYHWCFRSWLTTAPLFIPSYPICYLCWGSMCFTHPFSLVGYQSIQHNCLACIFVLPFVIFTMGWWEPPRDMLVHGKGLGDITRGAHNLKHKRWLPKDL